MSGVRRHYSAPAGRSNRSLMRASRTRAAGPSGAIMEAMHRGTLRIYLGAAPGVGKTYAMLGEAHRRSSRGTDVVIGLVEPHGRPHTAEQLEGLEVLPRAEVTHRGVTRTELDIEAVLARRPEVVVIDELAHTNAPGSRHARRWEDIDQVDMSPEALRRRLAHGNVYPAEQIDAALGAYFRIGNLTALRELALLWLADRVDEGLRRYRTEHAIDHVWEARERVVVTLTGGPEGDTLIRRGARIAARSARGSEIDLLAVHVLTG